jgi:hypothetical protein
MELNVKGLAKISVAIAGSEVAFVIFTFTKR